MAENKSFIVFMFNLRYLCNTHVESEFQRNIRSGKANLGLVGQ